MPMRQGGMFASRASTWRRESFWRRTIAPFLSRPTRWNAFLPMSMPHVTLQLRALCGDHPVDEPLFDQIALCIALSFGRVFAGDEPVGQLVGRSTQHSSDYDI